MTSTSATDQRPDPDRILSIATGFMAAQQLVAASRIGLFAALAEGGKDAAALADATSTPERQVRILADSMAAQGLLNRASGTYSLAPDAAVFLAGDSAELDLSAFVAFLGDISYKQWLNYDRTVDTDQAGTLDLDEAGWGRFMAGVMTYNQLHAQQLARNFDFSPYRSLLDIGGLSPAFALGGLQANPDLSARFVYAPDFVDSTKQALQEAGVADRATVEAGETDTAEPGGEHDLIMVNHVIHRFDEVQNRAIFQHVRDAAAPGATLMVLDFYLDDDPQQRALDAVHAGEYYNIDGTVVWPRSTVEEWLTAAGWKPTELVALPGSPRALLATAV